MRSTARPPGKSDKILLPGRRVCYPCRVPALRRVRVRARDPRWNAHAGVRRSPRPRTRRDGLGAQPPRPLHGEGASMKHRHGPGFPVMIASVVPPLLVTAWLTLAVLGGAPVPSAAAPGDPVVGAWATYQWTSAVREEVPVLIKQEQPGGEPTWTVTKESAPPLPLFVTYAIVRGDAKTYVLQIVTRQTPEGIPLAVTQITVDRQSGKA